MTALVKVSPQPKVRPMLYWPLPHDPREMCADLPAGTLLYEDSEMARATAIDKFGGDTAMVGVLTMHGGKVAVVETLPGFDVAIRDPMILAELRGQGFVALCSQDNQDPESAEWMLLDPRAVHLHGVSREHLVETFSLDGVEPMTRTSDIQFEPVPQAIQQSLDRVAYSKYGWRLTSWFHTASSSGLTGYAGHADNDVSRQPSAAADAAEIEELPAP